MIERLRLAASLAIAACISSVHAADPAWMTSVQQALGKSGKAMAGEIYRVGLPRTDLKVTVDGVEVKPALALGSWLAFAQHDASGMVFAEVAGAADHSDVVIARDDEVTIITDWALAEGTSTFAFDSCKNNETTTMSSLSIAVGEIDAAAAGPEIMLAVTPRAGDTGPSKIKIFSPDAVLAYPGGNAPAGPCFDATHKVLAEIDKTADNVTDLGKQMAFTTIAGKPMIIATAPASNKVFVFSGELGATQAVIEPPPGAGSIGDSLAVGDLDGDGVPELAIGDTRASPNGVRNAGAVFVFKYVPATGTFALVTTLHDAQPDVDQHFGTSVAIVPFGTGTQNILVAGDQGEVFTYFRLKDDTTHNDVYLGGDVRAGHH